MGVEEKPRSPESTEPLFSVRLVFSVFILIVSALVFLREEKLHSQKLGTLDKVSSAKGRTS